MSDEPLCAQKGPYQVALEAGKPYFWCACGRSAKQPFCDGSHKATTLQPYRFVAESSGTFNLFVLLLLVAVSSMLASSLPVAVLALTTPVSIAVALNFALEYTLRGYIMAGMDDDVRSCSVRRPPRTRGGAPSSG